MKDYESVYIAHRGLFNNIDIPENTISSFKKAVQNNYGIELDVQITKDNKLVVFHDETLNRMCNKQGIINDYDYDTLKTFKLLNTNEIIPLFSDVLKVLKKDTPLIIEIKPEGRCIDALKGVIEMMKNYDGLYNIESFNPKVVRYLRKNNPEIIRGQLSYNYIIDKNSKLNLFERFVLTNLLLNFFTRPDYVAYDCNNTKNISFRLISKLFKGECVAWTVKNQEQLEIIKPYYQQFIFDSFIPKNN